MRRLLPLALPAFALLLSGCGDDSTGPSTTLTAQDRQLLGSQAADLVGSLGASVGNYSQSATAEASGLAAQFGGGAARRLGTSNCSLSSLDTTLSVEGLTLTMKLSKPDGTPFASCDEAALAYNNKTGFKIVSTMSMDTVSPQYTMHMSSHYNMQYMPVGIDGYSISLTMSMSISGTENGQTRSFSVDNFSGTVTAASAIAEPSMVGTFSFTYGDLSFEGAQVDANGLVAPQTIEVDKGGSKVATIYVDASGDVVAKDLSGNVITN